MVIRNDVLGLRTSLVAQLVKNLPAMQAAWVRSLGWEDPVEKGMATHSSILLGDSYGQKSLEGYSPWGCKESEMTDQLTLSLLRQGFSSFPVYYHRFYL